MDKVLFYLKFWGARLLLLFMAAITGSTVLVFVWLGWESVWRGDYVITIVMGPASALMGLVTVVLLSSIRDPNPFFSGFGTYNEYYGQDLY